MRNGQPAFLVINIMWIILVATAWKIGLLDSFVNADHIENQLLIMLTLLFLIGQVIILLGYLDSGDRLAQFLPKVGLVCFGLAIIHLGHSADLSTGSGRSDFGRAVIEKIGLNVAAITYMIWLESIIWLREYAKT